MDGYQFDNLVRAMSSVRGRRGAVRTLAALGLGATRGADDARPRKE
jgi:hypothetical protein